MNQYTNPINKAKKQKMLLKTKEELVEILQEKEKRIQHLEELITEKMNESEKLIQKLEKLQEEKQQKASTSKIKYNKENSWVGKIITALTISEYPMQSKEIIRYIEEHDKEAFSNVIEKVKHLSPNLAKAVKYGRINKYKVSGILGHFYVLPQWLNEKGILKKEYKEREPVV
ncbi:MAG: hypothetical protein A2W98_08480 [Bacteroidetes bacterium GWF2_33_38]|nr:MAG: hypothetical protein A2W98_08480 [Bacteroidetes bacterium GWF2_33_38]OFY68040.1 MAG: hypothetical protein A2265_06770 [Bacteroidetes bacterium RIFOXYA12_FULL_33_9]OFY91293.1 MAG: hypothetical protein A2236_11105 [Bacteroidetes bacterium RIFOXYA2_FULL_33_7]